MIQISEYSKIRRLLFRYNAQEVANMYGVSRERIRQIAVTVDSSYVGNPRSQQNRERFEEISRKAGTMKDRDLARLYGVSYQLVYTIRKKLGIKYYRKPIGCPKCIINARAKGLCVNCYALRWRRIQQRKHLHLENLHRNRGGME